MSIIRNNTVILWKDFPFPMSIESFKIKEEAKVATYEYAGRNWAEHERVLKYRVFNITGIFTTDSWNEVPSFYVNKLRQLNDNTPWVLAHPVFWTYRCIIKNFEVSEDWAELEHSPGITPASAYLNMSWINLSQWWGTTLNKLAKEASTKVSYSKRAVPNYRFSIEFWESIPPTAASLQTSLNKLFPATTVKPANDNYMTSNKYKTVEELYWALVNGQILPGVDAIKNAEWLAYDYNFRKQAYDMWIADPKWVNQKSQTALKISTSKADNTYVVAVGDTALKVAKKLWTTADALFSVNAWKKVRTITKGADWLYWKRIWIMYPWDVLLIP